MYARGAVSFNAYFLVSTGRGAGMDVLSAEDTEALLAELSDLHKRYLGTMMVGAKCAPQFMREVRAAMPVDFSKRLPFFLRER